MGQVNSLYRREENEKEWKKKYFFFICTFKIILRNQDSFKEKHAFLNEEMHCLRPLEL